MGDVVKGGTRHQHRRDGALHVARTQPDQAVAIHGRGERIGRPVRRAVPDRLGVQVSAEPQRRPGMLARSDDEVRRASLQDTTCASAGRAVAARVTRHRPARARRPGFGLGDSISRLAISSDRRAGLQVGWPGGLHRLVGARLLTGIIARSPCRRGGQSRHQRQSTMVISGRDGLRTRCATSSTELLLVRARAAARLRAWLCDIQSMAGARPDALPCVR